MTGNRKVFISHAYQDNDACRPLLAALDAWDVDYWFQQERAEVDEALSPLVEQAIAESAIFLRVLSSAAQASYWVRLETEAFGRLRRDEPAEQMETAAGDAGEFADAMRMAGQDDREGLEYASDHDDLAAADDQNGVENADGEEGTEPVRQRIQIDVSLDGSLDGSAASEHGETVAHHIDMTRAHGLFWRGELQRALGLTEPGTETGEVPALSPSEVLSLVRAQAQSPASSSPGDDTVVSVALADRSAGANAAIGRATCLVMLQGKNAGHIYPLLADRVTLGRHRESDIFLEDLAVSRRHAALVRDATGRFVLYDENSKNGTFVNGQSVTERALEDGDSIRMGQCVLQFRRPRNDD